MNPILWAKIGLVGVFLAGAFISGHRIGANAVQADWDRDKAQRIEAQDKLIAQSAKDRDDMRDANELRSINAEKKHVQDIDRLNEKYTAAIAASNAAGGLRIPRSTDCGSAAAPTTSKSASYVDETATVRLPEKTERRLFELAQSADETALQLSALQQWVIDSGLYPKNEK